ncbi:type IV secretion protein Rhs [Ramlibacter sp. G-1-2-2]|uniref:Type IV secretion protein Rhs n=1 Tax=Ramlibacter agri TaxID=2728837 RepID=A0A848GXT9_9BURK|nr:RHS repeat-associated core domain-containing protein [Ramlibacter agri]NML43486.1 type IV secretion protein Rhs [Ramlibacter agri]
MTNRTEMGCAQLPWSIPALRSRARWSLVGVLAMGLLGLAQPALADGATGGSLTMSSISLSVSQGTTTLGQNLTLFARVSGASSTAPGTVTFTDGSVSIGTAVPFSGAATLSVTNLSVGTHSLAASYGGDAGAAGSTTPQSATVTVVARAGYVWQYGYDAMGRPNTVVDPNANATYIYRDSLGRPIQTQQPANTGSSTPTVTQFGYDPMGSLTSVADPRNLATTYTRNGLGDAKALSSPDSGNSQYAFDAKGNVVSSTDARGKTTTLAYDALDRLVSISYPTGTGTTFEYDGGASPTPAEAGELTKMTDASGQTTYAHDAMGRLTSKTVTIGSRTFTVGYAWGDSGSALDKLTAITYPSGARVNYSYDPYGSVAGITVNPPNTNGAGTSATSVTLLSGIAYNADSQVTSWQWSDGKARTIGYDANGMVSSYTLGDPLGTGTAAGVLRTLTRDAAGRITGYSHTNNGNPVTNLDQSFGYDNLNRLTSQTLGAISTVYSYDDNGNRTSKTIGGTSYTNTIAASSNRLTQASDVTGTASIAHDAAGNVTSDGTNSFAYSDRGRMVTASNAGGTVTYAYNGLELRASKAGPTALVPTGAAYYVFDEAGQLLGEYDASGTPLYETAYLGTSPVGVLKQSGSAATNDVAMTVYNAYADQIDTVRLITRQDHAIVWRWDAAEAFGATAPDQNPSSLGVFVFNQRFPGQVFDQETGLAQNWNREYNAKWGRYAQSDPIGLGGGINTFAYVEGDPLRRMDPRGEAGLIGAAGGVAVTVYGLSTMFSKQRSCEQMCDLTHGDDVKACGDPERQDVLDAQKNQRVLACKASCAMGSVMSRLLPGKLK